MLDGLRFENFILGQNVEPSPAHQVLLARHIMEMTIALSFQRGLI